MKLGNYIIHRTKQNGFLSAITKAERAYGKSMYNLKVMAYVYYKLEECSENYAWEKALENMLFTPDQFLNIIQQNIRKDIITPVICIDDAAVHFSSYLYFINLYETSLLNATFDTIRTAVNAVLINCPNKNRLLSGLRHYDDFEITIYKASGGNYYGRRAVGIKWYSLPDGHRRFRKTFEDHFSCYVPDWIYNKYMKRRKLYLKVVSDDLRALMDKLKKKKGEEKI